MRYFTYLFFILGLQNLVGILHLQQVSIWTGHIPSAQYPHEASIHCIG